MINLNLTTLQSILKTAYARSVISISECVKCQEKYVPTVSDNPPTAEDYYHTKFCQTCINQFTNKQLEKILRYQALI